MQNAGDIDVGRWNVCSLHGDTCPYCYLHEGDCCEKEMQELEPYDPDGRQRHLRALGYESEDW